MANNNLEAKIISIKDYADYNNKLSEVMEHVTALSDSIYECFFELACLDKWRDWSESQTIGTSIYVTEEMLRDTGDRNIDLLFEILDKIEEIKSKIRVCP